MFPKIFCILTSGQPLTEKVRDVLFENACDMIAEENEYQEIKGRDYAGVIKTDFETVSLGTAVGIVFDAAIEFNGKKTTVQYIVRGSDYEHFSELKWVDVNLVKQHETN